MNKSTIYKSEKGAQLLKSYYNNKILSDWPNPGKRINLPTTFGNTFVIQGGQASGIPVVLLHGSGSNAAMWKEDVRLYSKYCTTYAIDIPGECGNSDSHRFAFHGPEFSIWLGEVLNLLLIDKCTIIACSMGTWIALDFAIRLQHHVDKLVLIAAAGISNPKFSILFWLLISSLSGNWGFQKFNRLVYGSVALDSTTSDFITLIRQYYLPRTDKIPVFKNEYLEKIKQAILFIGGDRDCFYNNAKSVKRLEGLLVNFTGIILPDTGHVITGQAENILSFIND